MRGPIVLTNDGVTRSAVAWSKITGVSIHAIRDRLKRGWPTQEALGFVLRRRGQKIIFDGKAMTLREWADQAGINKATLESRIARGWPFGEAIGNLNRSAPPRVKGRLIDFDGERLTVRDWSERLGVSVSALNRRLSRNESLSGASHKLRTKIAFDGRTLTAAEWARETGILPGTIRNRLRHGWPIEEALGFAPRICRYPIGATVTFDGKALTMTGWSKITGIHPSVLYNRLKRGWTVDEALGFVSRFDRRSRARQTILSGDDQTASAHRPRDDRDREHRNRSRETD